MSWHTHLFSKHCLLHPLRRGLPRVHPWADILYAEYCLRACISPPSPLVLLDLFSSFSSISKEFPCSRQTGRFTVTTPLWDRSALTPLCVPILRPRLLLTHSPSADRHPFHPLPHHAMINAVPSPSDLRARPLVPDIATASRPTPSSSSPLTTLWCVGPTVAHVSATSLRLPHHRARAPPSFLPVPPSLPTTDSSYLRQGPSSSTLAFAAPPPSPVTVSDLRLSYQPRGPHPPSKLPTPSAPPSP